MHEYYYMFPHWMRSLNIKDISIIFRHPESKPKLKPKELLKFVQLCKYLETYFGIIFFYI